MPLKIAIMFVGQIRINGLYNNYSGDNFILESVQKYLLSDKFIQTFDYDVFISTDNIDIDKCKSFFGENLKNINIYEKEWFYEPISRDIKPFDYFYDNYMNIPSDGRIMYPQALYEMYRVYCAYNMIMDSETKNNINYDIIIKLRLDSRIMQDLYDLIMFFIENNTKILSEHDHFIMVSREYIELFDFIKFFGTYRHNVETTNSAFDSFFPTGINLNDSTYFFCPERQFIEYMIYLLGKIGKIGKNGDTFGNVVSITYPSYTILYRGNNSYGYSNYNGSNIFTPIYNIDTIKQKFGLRLEPEIKCPHNDYMNIVKSDPAINYHFTQHTVVENVVNNQSMIVNANGLTRKYTCFEYDNHDFGWYPINAGPGRVNGQEFSIDNQEILKKHLEEQMGKKDKLVILEIGVNRNGYVVSSTSVFLENKRPNDIYIGIDIEDKSELNDSDKNIFTIHSSSNNIDLVFAYLKNMGIESIDILMIDGYHSINQVYFEWENYTPLLASNGVVVMHDTNSHPGPYFLMKSIDTNQYDVYKYLNDVVDWGIGVAVRKV